jgi:hypothetical protein
MDTQGLRKSDSTHKAAVIWREPQVLRRLSILALCGLVWGCALLMHAQAVARDRQQDLERMLWHYTPEAYKKAAIKVLVEEANRAAHELGLPEKLPIKAEDLVGNHIDSPFWSEHVGAFGSIATSNYYYFASRDNKLSFIVRNLGGDDVGEPAFMESLKKRYLRPKSEMNTNAACAMALQWLAAAGMDTKALERDSKVRVLTWEIGDNFVPVYYVSWRQPYAMRVKVEVPDDDGMEPVASVQLVEPERRLLQMHVEKKQYIKRKPLIVPGRDELLQNTEDPKMREMWSTTEAYKKATLKAMLAEANKICGEMHLPEKLPIQSSDLAKVMIETPYFSDHTGRMGTISTENYLYGTRGNKLAVISKLFPSQDESQYLASLRARYTASRSRINTNAAYALATQWLAAASVDIKALERDYKVFIQPWKSGNNFVPLYSLDWRKEADLSDRAATVELVEPEHSLNLLIVEKPEYMKREPIIVADREKLLEVKNGK